MAKSREHFALDWIKGELLETLHDARQALEAFVESDRDETRMRACLTALHQVHGTLVMLELAGVTLLADHLEQLAQKMLGGDVEDEMGASQTLMQGILELPGHLEEIRAGAADSPKRVARLVNEVRAHLGQPRIDLGDVSSIVQDASESALDRFENIGGAEKTRKIRAAYQQVLLSILKGDAVSGSLTMLAKVAQGLQRVCKGTPQELQWEAFGEFVASLASQDGPLDSQAVKLLRRIDAEIRTLAQDGVRSLRKPVSVELIEELLGATAQRNHRSETTDRIRVALAGSGIDYDSVSPTGRQALSSAAAALREELLLVKDRLDLFVRSGDRPVEQLVTLVAPLRQIGSTLSILGFERCRTIVSDQIDTLNGLAEGEEVDQPLLLSIASALVQVDENLASFAQSGKNEAEKIVDEAERAVMVGARQALDLVKQDVVDFISSGWDPRHLKETPVRIAGICGALDMIPLARVSGLLASCGHYVASSLADGHTPTWQELDRVADAVSGVDYYLERIGEDTSFGADDVLDLVELSLADLGVDLSAPAPRPSVIEAPAIEPFESLVEASVADEAETLEEREVAAAALDGLTGAAVVPSVGSDDEEEEPKLGLDDDSGFDLEGADFDDLDAVVDSSRVTAGATSGQSVAAAPPPESSRSVDPSLADDFESDSEIVEIFIEEVDEVLSVIDEWVPVWREELTHEEALTEVRRSFHTLKGSGRIVGANVIGELAWSVENMLNRLIDGTVEPTEQFVGVVEQARALAPSLRDAFELKQPPDMAQLGFVMEQADVLASGGTLDDAGEGSAEGRQVAEAPGIAAPADRAATTAFADFEAHAEEDGPLKIFVAEATLHLEALQNAITADGIILDEAAVRGLHTLVGSAGMAELTAIEELARPTYELASALRGTADRLVTGEAADYFRRAVEALDRAVRTLAGGSEPEDALQLIAEADHLIVAATEQAASGGARSRVSLLGLDGLSELISADEFLESWNSGAMDVGVGERLMSALDGICRAAEDNEAKPIAALARALSGALTRLVGSPLGDAAHRILADGHERLLNLFDALAADQSFESVGDVVAALEALAAGGEDEAAEPSEEPASAGDNILTFPAEVRDEETADLATLDDAMGAGGTDLEVAPPPVAVEADQVAELQIAATAMPAAVAELLPEEVDDEIIEVFFEEAYEILEGLEENIHRWSSEPENRLYLEHLLRGLHTLKGGARLSGLAKLGDATHQLESFLIDVQNAAAAPDDRFFEDLHGRYDDITRLLSVIRKALAGETVTAEELAGGLAPETTIAPPAEETRPVRPPASAARHGTAAPLEPKQPSVPAQEPSPEEAAAQEPKGQEIVRVGSGLLEDLVNLAGESSIVRARVEQGMSDFTSALEEMETTIERLREQLRRLEIETEAQILFRSDRPDGPSYANFDPLEMDRYSQLQQLSRGLSESASDMLDLKETLLFKARESETLLLQQARINTELQEGLMRTRMVPFSRLLPRLRRIVRQVSAELGKEVEFHAYNAEGELDRSLLDRMIPPLEHMLRNAIDHGIETSELRKNFGKPGAGRIDLRLSREGGDVVIEISDDGAGIDVESVREKALEKGLLKKGTALSDDEIAQFVLAPGFTTAKSVTQISGRGVGLDVVASEVKQLGGSIQIASRPGKGTRFLVRVPFTVSVNRALMVSVGDDFYAVPLNNIEGIVLLSPEELERLYAPDANTFEYAGVPYRVRYLGHYLGREFRSSNQQSSVPVVLVRSGDHAVAVHVDGVQGSREIVVKSLGPQFAGVGGISGATILGDGNVVVILDLLALIRAHSGKGLISAKRSLVGAARTRCVMVVDDSVTVRKVTSRLLERQGMDVMVAKDGVEAVALLQERRPDVMLLDIEMPRMDGFEVARQVRHDERLSDLPIVMISSRTGEKHQEHAAELGVNSFLGKPFQENELLSTIDRLVD